MELENMSKEELIKLIRAYDTYIMEYIEDSLPNNLDRYPVCLNEFLDCEFSEEQEQEEEEENQ